MPKSTTTVASSETISAIDAKNMKTQNDSLRMRCAYLKTKVTNTWTQHAAAVSMLEAVNRYLREEGLDVFPLRCEGCGDSKYIFNAVTAKWFTCTPPGKAQLPTCTRCPKCTTECTHCKASVCLKHADTSTCTAWRCNGCNKVYCAGCADEFSNSVTDCAGWLFSCSSCSEFNGI